MKTRHFDIEKFIFFPKKIYKYKIMQTCNTKGYVLQKKYKHIQKMEIKKKISTSFINIIDDLNVSTIWKLEKHHEYINVNL